MNNKKTNKAQVLKWVKKWKDRLWLDEWDIVVTFEDIKHEKETKHYFSEGKSEVQQQYLTAHLTFANDIKISEETVLHELLHILTSELSGFSYANEGNEKNSWTDYFDDRLVTRLTRILLNKS